MKKNIQIIITSWLIICLFYIIFCQIPFWFGKVVYLKTTPVDPRDLLRGNYVNLNFEISRIEDYSLNHYFKKGYIILKTDENNIASYESFSAEKPKEGLFIKGEILNRNHYTGKYEAKYGIESYFLSPDKARKMENELSQGGVAKVKIDKQGNAKIVELKKAIF